MKRTQQYIRGQTVDKTMAKPVTRHHFCNKALIGTRRLGQAIELVNVARSYSTKKKKKKKKHLKNLTTGMRPNTL